MQCHPCFNALKKKKRLPPRRVWTKKEHLFPPRLSYGSLQFIYIASKLCMKVFDIKMKSTMRTAEKMSSSYIYVVLETTNKY